MKTKLHLPHLDAAENIFFQRELEEISAETFDILYADLKGLRMVGAITPDAGAETWTYRQFNKVGQAKRIKDYSKDFPMVGLSATEATQKIVSYGDGFQYSIQEIRAAAKAGRPLERDKAQAARDVMAQKLDDIIASGSSADGLSGLANLSGTNSYTIPNGASASKLWTQKTPAEIIADVNGVIRKVAVDSKEIEQVKRVVMPTAQYDLLATTPRTNNSDATILKFLQGVHPDVEFMSWERLAGAGGSSTDRLMAYNPDIKKVRLLLPVPFEEFPPQLDGMAYTVLCHMRTGGVLTPYPQSICYADGI